MNGPVEYVRVWQGEELPRISHLRPFKDVVIIQSPPDEDWQDLASEWLVASGCLYMMAWGEGCSSWDDSVDWANLREWGYEEVPEEHHVMTTWHEDEPLEEVFWFACYAASNGEVAFGCTVLVDVGPEDRRAEMISRYDQVARAG